MAADQRIEIAPQDRIELYADTARQFFNDVLQLNFDQCIVTDESYLSDFASCGMPDDVGADAQDLMAVYAAWDTWVLGEIARRYGLVYERTGFSLLTLLGDIEKLRSTRVQ